MKLLAVFVVLLEAIPLITAAALAIPAAQRQRPIVNSPQLSQSSSLNSFGSSGDSEPSTTRVSKLHIPSFFRSSKSPSHEFRCHAYPRTTVLGELSSYVTDLLKTYRDQLLSKKDDADRTQFKVCLAGYESSDVSPSIYFGEMTKRQLGIVDKVLRKAVGKNFPDMEVLVTGNALAIVQAGKRKVVSRATL